MPSLAIRRSTTTSIVCFFFLSSRIVVLERDHDAVHAHAGEAGLAHLVEHVLVLALPVLHERGQQQELRARRRGPRSRARSAALDCCDTGRPQLWQVRRPTRAHSTRR